MTSAKIIDGTFLAKEILEKLEKDVKSLKRVPSFVVVKVGCNTASEIYVRNKLRKAEEIGIKGNKIECSEDISQEDLITIIEKLNRDSAVDGIIVQLPLPKHIDENIILEKVAPEKDADCLNPKNIGRVMLGNPFVLPCTPQGILTAIKSVRKELTGNSVAIIGRSNIVGKPLVPLLLKEDCTVSVLHSKTPDLTKYTRKADIVIVAAGAPKFITETIIKEGAIVIDVGINRIDGKIVGDVDFERVKEKAFAITPVPKGIGPLTVIYLMKNIVDLYKKQHEPSES
ncbi:MAG: bifunctional methylenetetrahydrofolate dehydrogenase/methenyltetrahydrofolate cyclohydrolase [Alphaproteobacteria bacterium]|nr:bifunctional methylenetetrahydrofolate dehydrogenase/methenyltetrahydrofolate cyclohydrolase [Alphaproteobacteria bacterium]MBN2779927.1 bifunctional methylenetetrahydrofolate dehydrogenase/methenyltetrahydrofolate cyclohydrolase [Alphaproteobacteria bacterium]